MTVWNAPIMTNAEIPLGLLATLLFMTIGPIQTIPLFAASTVGMSHKARFRTAVVATGFAMIALALAVFVGAAAMARVGTTPSSLIMAAGLILTLTALRNILGGSASGNAVAGAQGGVALSPVAIPGLVTPVGVAILIIFVSYFSQGADKLAILAVVVAILATDLIAMLCAGWFMRVIGAAPLVVLGAVFGVLQAAMGVEMILSGIAKSPFGR